ncbi:hypothetical protein PRIPAC_86106 [Pristionchus pacificus]|uniref:Uncharacterized protein n=1 Tax=Pristionchus pacificus TaxID=54126 RepID=A0A2A6BS41_PRIPA|nr:hypothetical protein PRIPAC_86106 [Pristionchus pacificus]|eukprot:PDM68687.1 hypothetical protein PRIPAC_46989 [Pristionchus pacificus]
MSRILIALLLIASLAVAVSSAGVIGIPQTILAQLTNLASSITGQAFTVPANLSVCAQQKVQIMIASFNDLVEDIVEDLPNEITLANLPNWISQEMAEINNATAFIDPTCFLTVADQFAISTFMTFATGIITTLSFILASVIGLLVG